MRRLVLALLLAAAAGLSACKMTLPLVDRDSRSTAAVQVLRLRWSKQLAPELPNFLFPEKVEQYDRFNPIETSAAGFDTDKKRAFVGSSVGGLYCLDLFRGTTVWRFDIDDAVGSQPVYDKERRAVFFGADDGRFYALHARSGRLLWSVELGSQVWHPAILKNDTLFIITADDTVLALDPDKGETIWQVRRPAVEGFASFSHAGIAMGNDYLYTGFSDGAVAAIDLVSGATAWTSDLASEVPPSTQQGDVVLIDADATPVVEGNTVVAASGAGGLRGLDAATGTVRWTRPDLKGINGLAGDRGIAFAARSGVGVTAFEIGTGTTIWQRRFDCGTLSDPVIHDDVVILSDSERGLFVVSTADGRLLQRVDPKRGLFAQPALEGGYLLVLGNNGTLYAMSIL